MKRIVIAGMLIAALLQPRAVDAGCVCPDLTNVRVGDLVVANATIKAQTWTIASEHIEVKLQLTGVTAATTVDLLAMGVVPGESGTDPHATGTANGKQLTAAVSTTDGKTRALWKPGSVVTGDVTLELAWDVPAAGADESPATKERIKEFCIDAGTKKGLKKADGFHRVDVVLTPAMATDMTLRIVREELPVSLCAKNVKKLKKNVFEIRGRKNLQDQGGTLPILFGETI